jgi:hypothetical protein
MQLFFYNNDVKYYVKCTRWKWVKSKLNVPKIWPVNIGSNLLRNEILDFSYYNMLPCC